MWAPAPKVPWPPRCRIIPLSPRARERRNGIRHSPCGGIPQSAACTPSGLPAQPPGFTLVEIAVASAIIFILAALLISTASSLLERSRASICAGRLRNLYVLLQSYAADNGGYLPWYEREKGMNGIWWWRTYQFHKLSPAEASKIFTCPSCSEPRIYQKVAFNYAYNKLLGYHDTAGGPDGIWQYPQVNFWTANNAARIPVLADNPKTPGDNAPGFEGGNRAATNISKAHVNETIGNMIMLDGHLEQINAAVAASNNFNWRATNN